MKPKPEHTITVFSNRVVLTGIVGAFLALTPPGPVLAQENSQSATTEWSQNVESLKPLAAEQRDEAVEAGRSAIDAIDQRIDELQSWTSENWNDLSAEARQDRREILNDLRSQRSTLAEWVGAMKHGSAEAWEDVKQGFMDAYNALGDSFNAAVDEFKDDDATQ
jgi:hypothetical protein